MAIAAFLYRVAASMNPCLAPQSEVSNENMRGVFLAAWELRDNGMSLRLCQGACARLLAGMQSIGDGNKQVKLEHRRPWQVGKSGNKKELYHFFAAGNFNILIFPRKLIPT